ITEGASIQQRDKNGGTYQQWRFLPVGAPVEFTAPAAPAGLIATANASSIRLDWSANTDTDLSGYTIFRSEVAGGPYNTIARNVKSNSFVDNTTTAGKLYFYSIKAVDNSLNRSTYSNEVSATATGVKDLVANLRFDGTKQDSTINLNHSASYGGTSFVAGKVGQAIALNGSTGFVQLPANVANGQEITIAAWVYWNGITSWQRIFDFGNDQNQYMFLSPRSGSGVMRFGIKNGGTEQGLTAAVLPYVKWTHVAVTLGATGARMFVNGLQVAESNTVTIRPSDFKPVLNYIGRSQFSDPLFNGSVDDFRVYNYALSANEIAQIAGIVSEDVSGVDYNKDLSVWPVPANDIIHVNYAAETNTGLSTVSVFNMDGRLVISKEINNANDSELNVSGLPSGIYMLKLTNREETLTRKILIKH
ncbi:MAG TPA: LamG-like jellyroll fold domain-containing protein, partial [Paludibacter sp.]|nr:LamG-like jellyroll fold domain-containing protein [Paludibacter sp.]